LLPFQEVDRLDQSFRQAGPSIRQLTCRNFSRPRGAGASDGRKEVATCTMRQFDTCSRYKFDNRLRGMVLAPVPHFLERCQPRDLNALHFPNGRTASRLLAADDCHCIKIKGSSLSSGRQTRPMSWKRLIDSEITRLSTVFFSIGAAFIITEM